MLSSRASELIQALVRDLVRDIERSPPNEWGVLTYGERNSIAGQELIELGLAERFTLPENDRHGLVYVKATAKLVAIKDKFV